MICWELNPNSGFFAFLWLSVWVDGINKCGWCLAGAKGCCLKGPNQMTGVGWIFYHFLLFTIYYIVSFVPGILLPLNSYA